MTAYFFGGVQCCVQIAIASISIKIPLSPQFTAAVVRAGLFFVNYAP
ncbi:MAG TPA: hypothetical protein VFI93_11120 [Rhizomicrobium sp.]|nr:hypothetical protein [Rhizomicrobium sp.]